jgi:exodeoxyribonuclease VII large subunit
MSLSAVSVSLSGRLAHVGPAGKRQGKKPWPAASAGSCPALDARPATGQQTFMADAPLTNAPEFTVSEIALAVKRSIEDEFGSVRVRGEISGFRGQHASGHAYFTLKDADAVIDAVVWRTSFSKLRFKPQEGLEVVVTGRLTTYPRSSKYQIVIEQIEPAGAGALMALLEERRRRLAAEGLFDRARKRPLPYLPRVIGVVTSPTGAVIRDILHRLEDRFPSRVVVWPVRVQGETSAEEVAAAVAGFNALDEGGAIPRPDLLIIARGGGSIEDLWGFNEEIVVRAVAASAIPTISAVGHETDTTLCDFAADMRAPTPTAAAEAAVPVRAELIAYVEEMGLRQRNGARRLAGALRDRLRAAGAGLPRPLDLVSSQRQRLDHAATGLFAGLRHMAQMKSIRLARAAPRLAPHLLTRRLGDLGQRFSTHAGRLRPCFGRLLEKHDERVAGLGRLLLSFSHKGVLARGFALVKDASGTLVRRSETLAPGDALRIEFADGEIGASVAGALPPAREAKRKPPGGQGQGSLF